MNKIILFLFFIPYLSFSQASLDALLKQYNTEKIPYIFVEELKEIQESAVLLDAREQEEYEISHLQGATCVGYDHFKIKNFTKQNLPKDTLIVVYCSLGIRSEDIAEKLKKKGYTNVRNLYGGIFEWKNKGNVVLDTTDSKTEKVHAFSEEWSKWLTEGEKFIPVAKDTIIKN